MPIVPVKTDEEMLAFWQQVLAEIEEEEAREKIASWGKAYVQEKIRELQMKGG